MDTSETDQEFVELNTIYTFIEKYEKPNLNIRGLGLLVPILKVCGLYAPGRTALMRTKSTIHVGFVTLLLICGYFCGDYFITSNFSNREDSWNGMEIYDISYYIGTFWAMVMFLFWTAGIPTIKFMNHHVKSFHLKQVEIDGLSLDFSDLESVDSSVSNNGSTLCQQRETTGTIVDLLNGLDEKEYRKLGNKTFAYLLMVSAGVSSLTVIEGLFVYTSFFDENKYVVLFLCNRFFWMMALCVFILPWYAIFALSMVLMEHKIQKIHYLIKKFFSYNISQKYTDFDFIIHHRHSLTAYTEGLSTRFGRLAFWSVAACAVASVGFTFRAIGMGAEEVGYLAYTFIAVLLLAFVLYVLSFSSLIYSASRSNFEYLNDIRSRFPAREEYENRSVVNFNYIQKELDSFISHCHFSPMGFKLHGLRVTPHMVKAVMYTLLSVISIFVQMRVSKK